MRKLFCDKCKKEIYGGGGRILTYTTLDTAIEKDKPSLQYDLCSSCYKKLQEFLKSG